MKTSRFVATNLEPFPEKHIHHNVRFEAHVFDKSAYSIEQRVALHLCQGMFIHAQLTESNTVLELRPFTLTESTQSLTPVRIVYSYPIVSPIVFAGNRDKQLDCWLISQDNQIVRHRFDLDHLFTDQTKDLDVVIRPLASKYVSLSATAQGVATVGFDDGSVTHFQEGTSFPSSSYRTDAVDTENEKLCSYKLHESTTFPLLKYLNFATRRILNFDLEDQGPSTQAGTAALASSLAANVMIGLRKDHRLVSWSWNNNRLDRKLLELPQFEANGNLIDQEEQDMSYHLPGSFVPKHQARKGELKRQDGHSYDAKILTQDDGQKAIVYIDTENEPFFAIYDISGSPILIDVITTARHPTGRFLGFNACLEKNSLRLWTIWQEAKTVFIKSSDTELIAGDTAPHVHRQTWFTMSFDLPASNPVAVATAVVSKDLLVATDDRLLVARDLDKIDELYLGSEQTSTDDPLSSAVSILATMSISIYPGVWSQLEAQLRNSFSKTCDPFEFYKEYVKDLVISIISSLPSIDKSAATSILRLLRENQPAFDSVHASQITSSLVMQAISETLNTRYKLLFCLFLALCGSDELKDDLPTCWELLRNVDSLRWCSQNALELLVSPIIVPTKARLNVGVAAYYALSEASSVIENCDKLARVGDAEAAQEMAQLFVNMNTDDQDGKVSETLRAVKFRGFLASHKFDIAIDTLAHMIEGSVQEGLLENLIDEAYNAEEYQVICKMTLRKDVVAGIIRDRGAKQQLPLSKRLSWWQVGYSFFTIAEETESANECMRKHLKLTGSRDVVLKEFFA
ncbi:hypothetical protein BJV82DRAFT_602750 [Fennellomyces sp. T-0311]|nr:hypothetical protein BJV82DRAFT_602750 [Fennellomyces sp. T-0311]